ncbi:MAG TPA: serine/threonine protein kinase, partial [Opitutae bacterium]|nr:serine/threonine protein kinase [Opitutae bacterium]
MIVPIQIITLLSIFQISVLASDWPQWRGPDSNGIADASDLPTVWSKSK